jgi:uncharacterized glyoxalase superfamily protein PhnB
MIGSMTNEAPPPQVWPSLGARDARALITFLVDAFGFEETVCHSEGDQVHHAELAWPPGGGIMLGSSSGESPMGLKPGTFHAYAVTDDPDVLFARAVSNGAEVVRELTDQEYGSREFAVRDPEGNHWSFGTYRGEPR